MHLCRFGFRRFLAVIIAIFSWNAVTAGAEAPHQAPVMRNFMGVNGHFTFKPELYRPVCNLVRNYHPTEWDLGKETSRPPDYPFARNKVNWAHLYGTWQKAGFTIDACLQYESIKADKWKDLAADSRMYGEAFARAFGPSSKAVVESAEIGNEPADWDNASYRVVFENMAKGLRAGDPKLKIVTAAASAGAPDKYSKDVSTIKGLESLYDVLNVHTYSMIEGWPTWRRVWPEHPDIPYLKTVKEMLQYRDAHAPGKEVWITEFGYDAGTKKPGPGTFAGWISSTETEQAQWIVRSFLMFSSMGVDRAYVYYYDDKDEPSFHASSGLTRNFIPKPSYYAMAHLYKTLGDYRFNRIVQQDSKDMLVFEYVKPDQPGDFIWVAWSPTGTQREESKTLILDGTLVRAERMPLKAGEVETVPLATRGGGTLLPLTESPIYLWLKK